MQEDQKPQGFRDPVHAVVRPAQLLLMNDLFQIPIKKFPKPWMAFYQAGNMARSLSFLLCLLSVSRQALIFPAKVSSRDATRIRIPCMSAGTDRPGKSLKKSSVLNCMLTLE